MTQIALATDQELANARDDSEFPDDLSWTAAYHIREHQQTGDIHYHNIRWAYALDHELMGLENLIKGTAETHIVDDLDSGVHVAHSFEMAIRDGHVTALGKIQRATQVHGYGYEPSHEKVLARAEIRVAFESARTDTLVRAALEEQNPSTGAQDKPAEPNLLQPQGQLPGGLDMTADYTVLLEPGRDDMPGPPPNIDWTGALNDDGPSLSSVLAGEHTCVIEDMGAAQAFAFTFSVNDRDKVVAHATLHPACEPDLEPDLDTVLAEADIIIAPHSHKTAAALRQYIRFHYPED